MRRVGRSDCGAGQGGSGRDSLLGRLMMRRVAQSGAATLQIALTFGPSLAEELVDIGRMLGAFR